MRWACLLALVAVPTALWAQTPDNATYQAMASASHPRSTVVSVVVRIPQGSGVDPVGLEGTAWMVGELLAHGANDRMGPDALVTVAVDRNSSVYTLLAVPETWQQAWGALEDILFQSPLTDTDVEHHRQDVLDALGFSSGSPVRGFQLESARMVAPTGHAWARPVLGTPESVSRITPSDLRAFKAAMYRAADATVALVGPRGVVPPLGAPDAVPGEGTRETGDSLAAERPREPASALPWQVGGREELVQDITNTWVTVAWPVAPEVDRTSLEFLTHLLNQDLDPTPPDPDRFSVDVRLVDTPTGVALVVEAAVFPEAADRWEERILESRLRLAREVMDEDFLGWRRRRFRTARLLSEAAPEAEAARLAEDLARSGRVRDLSLEIWELNGPGLLAAARGLGEARILRLGPDLVQDASRN